MKKGLLLLCSYALFICSVLHLIETMLSNEEKSMWLNVKALVVREIDHDLKLQEIKAMLDSIPVDRREPFLNFCMPQKKFGAID